MTIRVVGAAIFNAGRLLIAQRGSHGPLPGKWEFPGGKIEHAESPEQTLIREIDEELGCPIRVGRKLGEGVSITPERTIELQVFEAFLECPPESVQLRVHQDLRWITALEIADFDWAEADIPSLPAVAAALAAHTSTSPKTHID
jgi:8-oxo-dGTP diphosphatase